MVGDKGSGKTTVLRNLANEGFKARTEKDQKKGDLDFVYLDAGGCDKAEVVDKMIGAMPNRLVSSHGEEDLVNLVSDYSHRPVFMLDNLDADVCDSLCTLLGELAGRKKCSIVSTGYDKASKAHNTELERYNKKDLLKFFMDIYAENSTTPMDDKEKDVVEGWIRSTDVSPQTVITVSSICAKLGMLSELQNGVYDPLDLVVKSDRARTSYGGIIYLLLNTIDNKVPLEHLESVIDEWRVRDVLNLGICDSANGIVSLYWVDANKDRNEWKRHTDIALTYIAHIMRTESSSEYRNVMSLLSALIDDDPDELAEMSEYIREFVKKARFDIPRMENLIGRLKDVQGSDGRPIVSETNIHMERANLLYREGRLKKAEMELERKGNNNRYRGKIELAGIRIRQCKPKKAKSLLESVLEDTDVDSRMLYSRTVKLLGDVELISGNYDAAMERYSRALELSEAGNDRYLNETLAYSCRGMIDAMISYGMIDDSVVMKFREMFQYRRGFGFASTVHASVQSPRRYIYVSLMENDGSIGRLAGYIVHGETKKAKALLDEIDPSGTYSLVRGDLCLLTGRFEKADEYYNGSLESDPVLKAFAKDVKYDERGQLSFAVSRHCKADVLLNTNDLAEAKKEFEYACEAYSKSGTKGTRLHIMALMGMADAYRRTNDAVRSAELYLKATDLMGDLKKAA